jgi:hypothetical protein
MKMNDVFVFAMLCDFFILSITLLVVKRARRTSPSSLWTPLEKKNEERVAAKKRLDALSRTTVRSSQSIGRESDAAVPVVS